MDKFLLALLECLFLFTLVCCFFAFVCVACAWCDIEESGLKNPQLGFKRVAPWIGNWEYFRVCLLITKRLFCFVESMIGL